MRGAAERFAASLRGHDEQGRRRSPTKAEILQRHVRDDRLAGAVRAVEAARPP